MNILMIGPFPDPVNGQSIANKMLLEGLKKEGHNVEFVDTNTDKQFVDFSQQGKFNYRKIMNSLLPMFIGMYKIIFQRFDSIYITPAQSYIGFLRYAFYINAAYYRKIPCYIHFHGGYVRKMYNEVDNRKKKILLKYFNRCSGIIVLGNSLRKMLEGLVPDDKIFVCENGVENEFFITNEELSNKLNRIKHTGTINLLYLSNLMETKGILDLLEACIKLKEMGISYHIDVAGNIEPNIKEKVLHYFNRLGDNLTYHGVVEGAIKRYLLEKADIFCLPTYYPNEGQPISILEAMAMGNAVVTTYQGGIEDIFKDQINGSICIARDSVNICSAIVNTYKSIENFILHNRATAVTYYREESFTKRILKIINSNNQ